MLANVTADDFFAIGFLVFLEGVLSLDNALVLALIVSNLPKHQRKKALTYGLVGAVVFRLVAVSLASYLMGMKWVKFVGGGYLLYLSLHYWWTSRKEKQAEQSALQKSAARGFWMTVVIVELTDIAFAVDSILTAVAITKDLWVVITGGLLGLLMMRFAAAVFIRLLEKFPRFEPTAYLLVFIIGVKLLIDGFEFASVNFHDARNPAFWIFWVSMALSLGYGFTKRGEEAAREHHVEPKA